MWHKGRTFNSLFNTNPLRNDTLDFLVPLQVNIHHGSPSNANLSLKF